MREESFLEALRNVKVPILVLDQKWHRLFAVNGKPQNIKDNEATLKTLLAEQGKLNNKLKEVKKVKANLMQGIVVNMDNTKAKQGSAEAQVLADNKRLVEEANQKIDEIEDELLELPKQIKAYNQKLMLDTMAFCYDILRTNSSEISEISEWITGMRIELKKNIIRKQNREINNREIYAYMNDIFGKDIVDLFDIKYEDYEENLKAHELAVAKAKQKAEELARLKEENKEKENINVDN